MDDNDAFGYEWFKCNIHVYPTIKTNFDQQRPGIHNMRKYHSRCTHPLFK